MIQVPPSSIAEASLRPDTFVVALGAIRICPPFDSHLEQTAIFVHYIQRKHSTKSQSASAVPYQRTLCCGNFLEFLDRTTSHPTARVTLITLGSSKIAALVHDILGDNYYF